MKYWNLLICVVLLSACGEDDIPELPKVEVEGIWEWYTINVVNCDERVNNQAILVNCSTDCLLYEFYDDGTGRYVEDEGNAELTFTWTSDENLVTVDYPGGNSDIFIRTDDNRLLIKSEPNTINYQFDDYGKGCEVNVVFVKKV